MEALALLLVVAVVAARAVPGLRWAAAVAAWLLRASTGGALLPVRPVASVGPVVSRVVAVGAASLVGIPLFVTMSLLASELVGAHPPASCVAEEVRLTAVTIVVGLAVLLVVARPGRLRRSDGVVLLAAGLVAYPLSTLASVAVRGAWPSGLWSGLIAVALVIGGALTVWATRSERRDRRVDPVAGR